MSIILKIMGVHTKKNTKEDENVRTSNDVLQDDCMYKNTASGFNDEECSSQKEGTNDTADDTGNNIEKQSSCMEPKKKELSYGMNIKKIDSYEYFKFNIDVRRCLQRYVMKCTQWITSNDHIYWYFGYYSNETSLEVKMTLIDYVQKNLQELEDFFQYALANSNCMILSYIEFISQSHLRIFLFFCNIFHVKFLSFFWTCIHLLGTFSSSYVVLHPLLEVLCIFHLDPLMTIYY